MTGAAPRLVWWHNRRVFGPAEDARGLEQSPGHWLRRDLIAWPASHLPPGEDPAALDWRLHWSADDHIDPTASEPLPWPNVALSFDPDGLPHDVAAQFPHLGDHLCLRLPPEAVSKAREALRCQVAVSAELPSGRLAAAGQLQLPGVIDQLYAAAEAAELGPTWHVGTPTLRVWAPTAREVALLLWPEGEELHDPPQRTPDDPRRRRHLGGDRRTGLARCPVPLRGHGLRPAPPPGRGQPGDRPVLGRAHRELDPLGRWST